MNEEEDEKFKNFNIKYKQIVIALSALSLLVLMILILSFSFLAFKDKPLLNQCGDGTLYDSCSHDKPYYCETGQLIEKASSCGCPDFLIQNQDNCVLKNPETEKSVYFDYFFENKEKTLRLNLSEEVYKYVIDIVRYISYTPEETPLRKDFKMKKISDEIQREFVLELVKEIQNLAPDSKLNQLRIAVSLVQNIPWKVSEKDRLFAGSKIYYSRYPYEVLYENQGICGEKSELLALLLKEMGYGSAIFYFPKENHEALGIKCPVSRSFQKSGYCFVETSGPSIISDSSIVYSGGIVLESEPEVIEISEGDSLPLFIKEYFDVAKLNLIRNNLLPGKLGESVFVGLQRSYGLTESYHLS